MAVPFAGGGGPASVTAAQLAVAGDAARRGPALTRPVIRGSIVLLARGTGGAAEPPIRWADEMKVFAALRDELSEGHVWLETAGWPARCIVAITNGTNGKRVYCEALQFDDNFIRDYNQQPRISIDDRKSTIVMNYWYRARLGDLETHRDYPLVVAKAAPVWGSLKAGVDHPQVIVRLAIRLAVWSVFLGIAGVVLGIISILK